MQDPSDDDPKQRQGQILDQMLRLADEYGKLVAKGPAHDEDPCWIFAVHRRSTDPDPMCHFTAPSERHLLGMLEMVRWRVEDSMRGIRMQRFVHAQNEQAARGDAKLN